MFEVSIICGTVLICLMLTLKHLSNYATRQTDFEATLTASITALVDAKLTEQTGYRKDLETVNANQLKLANELELIKKTQQLRTTMGRPQGSIV